MNIKARQEIKRNKRPRTKQKHIGVELEFISPWSEDYVIEKLYEAGLSKNITVKYDGSISTTELRPFAIEVCVLATERTIHGVIKKACAVLNKIGCEVNRSCGLHVHLDMRDREPLKSFRRLWHVQDALYSVVHPSRKTNRYCRHKSYCSWGADNKYFGINTQSYDTKGTIEVRMHHGTLNAIEISNWIKLLTTVLARPNYLGISNSRAFRHLKLSRSLSTYFANKRRLYRTQ